MTQEQALTAMLEIHHHGKVNVGTYPKDIAETKANQAIKLAVKNGHSHLEIVCEPQA